MKEKNKEEILRMVMLVIFLLPLTLWFFGGLFNGNYVPKNKICEQFSTKIIENDKHICYYDSWIVFDTKRDIKYDIEK